MHSQAAPRLRLTISWPVLVAAAAALLVAILPSGAARGVLPGPARPASWSGQAPGSIAPDLARLAREHPGRQVEVIVQLHRGASPAQLFAQVAAEHGTVIQRIPLIDGVAARVPAGAAVRLADVPGVRAVSPNAKVTGQGFLDPTKLQSAYIASIRADKAWYVGVTGQGVGVAVVDTGLAGKLVDFQVSDTNTASRGIVSAVVNPQAANAQDTYGHGTHVAGLIAGNGFNRSASDPSYGHYAGVAPYANLIAIKADTGNGTTDVLSIIDGLQFAVSHKAQYNIRVVNLSVRSASAQSYKTDPLDAAAEATWMHGIVVVAAAGNAGTAPDAVSYAPGNDPYVITVGGVDDQGTKGTSDDVLASWSSRGVTQDGFAKPDVVAPGAHLVSTLSPGSYYQSACPSCIVEGQYLRIGGTSMAAGVVSGAVADILQVHPDWTPDQVKSTLVKRSRAVATVDGTAQGYEIALDKVLGTNNGQPEAPANQGLTPSSWIDPSTGTIKSPDESWAAGSWGASSWGASSWGASSWGAASGSWVADWASASFMGSSVDPNAFNPGNPQQCWQLARTGWSASSWGASSWGAAQLTDAQNNCTAAAQAAASGTASSWGASSWGASSWGASSWGASSWGASSWGASSWGASSWGASSWASAWDK